MLNLFFQSLAVALLGLLAPGSILLVILLLMTDRGLRNGIAFTSGYIVSYFLIGVAVLVLGSKVDELPPLRLSDPNPATPFILIGVGIVLLISTLRALLKRPEENMQQGRPSRFNRFVDGITPLGSFGLAAVFSVANVKNLTFFLSATYVLLLSDLLLVIKLSMLVPVVLVFSIVVIIPVVIYLLFPDRANTYLNRIKEAINNYSRPLTICLMFLLGCYLLYRGVIGL